MNGKCIRKIFDLCSTDLVVSGAGAPHNNIRISHYTQTIEWEHMPWDLESWTTKATDANAHILHLNSIANAYYNAPSNARFIKITAKCKLKRRIRPNEPNSDARTKNLVKFAARIGDV